MRKWSISAGPYRLSAEPSGAQRGRSRRSSEAARPRCSEADRGPSGESLPPPSPVRPSRRCDGRWRIEWRPGRSEPAREGGATSGRPARRAPPIRSTRQGAHRGSRADPRSLSQAELLERRLVELPPRREMGEERLVRHAGGLRPSRVRVSSNPRAANCARLTATSR